MFDFIYYNCISLPVGIFGVTYVKKNLQKQKYQEQLIFSPIAAFFNRQTSYHIVDAS